MSNKPEQDTRIKHLRELYRQTRNDIDRVKDDVREEYEALMIREAQRRRGLIESGMAEAIQSALKQGVSSSRIRAEVIKTNVWDRWLFWRDYEVKGDK